MSEKSVDLVLEGGGVKGIALLGAVLVLADAGYRFQRIAGTSAGAIVAALVAAYQKEGKNLAELADVMREVDYRRFADEPWPQRATGVVGDALSAFVHGGSHGGDYLVEWLTPLLADAGVHRFADLRCPDEGGSLQDHQKYSLVVHASDLSRRALVRLPWDYALYDLNADDQSVVDAVRASMAIPFYFRPVHVATRRGTCTWVDGGLLANFPITVFDRTDGEAARWPTWGVKLSGRPVPGQDLPVRTVPGIAVNCLRTLTGDWNRHRLDSEGVGRRTMFVDTMSISATDFGISRAEQEKLFDNGRRAAQEFLDVQSSVRRLAG
ncbi:patatin-like phospholipase family protein [Lentzea flava]|uniref:Membrane protein n=1 Tax=Lentzea flava TaxID=103732 RepID=A0ABQ2UGX9_9PSEU|nr:patatin-like phospholipase family protein [Lentzea flava]MCP2198938.1 NTE family protein [Lentzea flava]GGU32792.1 membrane protein [Lentzea flava]